MQSDIIIIIIIQINNLNCRLILQHISGRRIGIFVDTILRSCHYMAMSDYWWCNFQGACTMMSMISALHIWRLGFSCSLQIRVSRRRVQPSWRQSISYRRCTLCSCHSSRLPGRHARRRLRLGPPGPGSREGPAGLLQAGRAPERQMGQ